MMPTVTADVIWAEVQKDSEFQQFPQALQEAIRPYVEALPSVLAMMLSKPATLSNIMESKVIFLRYCAENGYIQKAINAMPEESFGFFSREEMPGLFESSFKELVAMAEELIGDTTSLLKAAGVTEEQVMLGEQLGLQEKTRQRYLAGDLTIGELLILQPMLIIKNTK